MIISRSVKKILNNKDPNIQPISIQVLQVFSIFILRFLFDKLSFTRRNAERLRPSAINLAKIN